MLANAASTRALAPSPMATMAITAADADDDAERGEERAQSCCAGAPAAAMRKVSRRFMRRQRLLGESRRRGLRGACRSSGRRGRRASRRPATRSAATSGSWVTSTMVIPAAPQLLKERHHLEPGAASRGCRWARRRGSPWAAVTSARAMATRCCCPPESCEGWCSTGRRARPGRAPARARRARSRAAHVGVDQRQLDVLERAGAREQVEALEDEADRPVAHLGELGPVEAARRPGRRAGSCRWSAGRGSR